MRLIRLALERYGAFTDRAIAFRPDARLHVVLGANEAGKSTVVRAIRAAFFERHRSSGVEDLVPYGDTAASPTIEIDFETGAQFRCHQGGEVVP